MNIISVSLDDENISALKHIQETYRLVGRSQAIRMSINAAIADIKEIENIIGVVDGVFVIVRDTNLDPQMISIQSRYESSIKTQMHFHLQDHKCLEVMIISCEASVLYSMIRNIKTNKNLDYVRFIRT